MEKELNNYYTAVVITVSDRASMGVYEDKSGPAVCDLLESEGFDVCEMVIVADEKEKIAEELKIAVANDVMLVVTTGGTGPSNRDVTPEATLEVLEKLLPGVPEAMRTAARMITPHAILSREVAGIAGKSIIVNVPGSPKAAVENLSVVLDALKHGIDVLNNSSH